MSATQPPAVSVDTVMAELQDRVRVRLREELLQHGASRALEDPEVFAEVERMLRDATSRTGGRALLLPELLGDPAGWRIEPALSYPSHRTAMAATVIRGLKRRVLMPVLRWLFEYSHDNFVRQQRVNHVLFACVQELAIQNAELRRHLRQLSTRPSTGPPANQGRPEALDGR
ncbi:MAG: hypothetical protein ACRD26_19670 [Vicinamibacterales bacterium]